MGERRGQGWFGGEGQNGGIHGHVGQGRHLGGLSVFPVWTDAPVVSGLDKGRTARVQVAEREGVQEAKAAELAAGIMNIRSPHHEIRVLDWDDEVLHATVFNRRHHLMELA